MIYNPEEILQPKLDVKILENITKVPAFTQKINLEKSFEFSFKSEPEVPKDLVQVIRKSGNSSWTIHDA